MSEKPAGGALRFDAWRIAGIFGIWKCAEGREGAGWVCVCLRERGGRICLSVVGCALREWRGQNGESSRIHISQPSSMLA